MDTHLPMMEARGELLSLLDQHQVVIVVGETGCGKTTQIPQILLEAQYANKGLIACTEPRRIAAIAAARRVAYERREMVGSTVGYHVRFEEEQGEATQILFLTDGMLLRQAQGDPWLRRYSLVMVDEAHERNLYTDFTLAYLKSLLTRRPDLKVIISSATIDPAKFMAYFRTFAVLRVPGRLFPVEVEYREAGTDIIRAVAREVQAIHTHRESGHILVFLPGVGEIRAAHTALRGARLRGIHLLPLYGGMDPTDQERVFEAVAGRKIILATNVAETGITIPGVRYVVDAGLARLPGWDHERAIETLTLEQISQASATQRAGRAGRTQAGVCIRLQSEAAFKALPRFTEPEITRSDLTGLVLTARRYEIKDVARLDLLTRPPRQLVDRACATLASWGALDISDTLTEFGEQLAAISVDPALARFVILSAQEGCLKEAATIAAFLSVRNLFFREGGIGGFVDAVPEEFQDPMGDLYSYLRVWFSYNGPETHPNVWCRKHRINPRVMVGITRIRAQIIREAVRAGLFKTSSRDRDTVGRAITRAFGHQLCTFEGAGQYRSGALAGIRLPKSSPLCRREPEQFLAVSFLDTGKSFWAHGAVELQPEWIDCLAPEEGLVPRIEGDLPDAISGKIRITDQGRSRTVYVHFDPGREEASVVQTVAQGSLALDLRKLPFVDLARLPQLQSAAQAKALPLTVAERQAPLLTVLEEEEEELRERLATGAAVIEDRLVAKLLDQPFQALDLSSRIAMKLISGGIKTVRDLTECTEEQLAGQRGRRGQQGFRFAGLPAMDEGEINEISEQFSAYGLELADSAEFGNKRLMPDEGEKRVVLTPVEEERARTVLGNEDFDNFTALHSPEAPRAKRLAARNDLAVKHYRLPWSVGIKYEWVIPVHEQDLANEGQDYGQEGTLGLLRAIVKFKPNLGYRFSTYAVRWIKNAITRFIANSGTVRIPAHRFELENRILKKIQAFEAQNGRAPTADELAELLGIKPEEVLAVLDEIHSLRRILRLEYHSREKRHEQDEMDSVLADIIPDPQSWFEEQMIQAQFAQEVARMLQQSPLLEIDRRILELRFGLNGEREHSAEEIGAMYRVTPKRIYQRLQRALDTLRTRGNWERMAEYRTLPPLAESESKAQWERAMNALVAVLAPAEEQWDGSRYLEELAKALEISPVRLVQEAQDTTVRGARAVAAGLLWSPCGLELADIAQQLHFQSEGEARNAIFQLSIKLEKKGWNALAAAFKPQRPARKKPVSPDQEPTGLEFPDTEELAAEIPVEVPAVPVLTAEEVAQVHAQLDRVELTPRQRQVLEARLALDHEGHTLGEIGKELGLTRERARQIQESAIRRAQESAIWEAARPLLEPLFADLRRPAMSRLSRSTQETIAAAQQAAAYQSSALESAPQNNTAQESAVHSVMEPQVSESVPTTAEKPLVAEDPFTNPALRIKVQWRPYLVLEAVCQITGIPIGDLRGPKREQRIVSARAIAMYILREFRVSYPQIGVAIARDHSTVMHNVERVAQRMDQDPELPPFIEEVLGVVAGKALASQTPETTNAPGGA